MHTTSIRRSIVACLVALGLTLASCSSGALMGAARPDTASDRFAILGGEANQVPNGAETATGGRTILGGEKNQVPASARTAANPHESPEVLRTGVPTSDRVSVVVRP